MKKDILAGGTKFLDCFTSPLVADDVNAYELVYHAPQDLSGAAFMVTAIRADGVKITDSGSVDGKTARYTLKNSMHAVPGDLRVRLSVLDADGSCLTTKELNFVVVEGNGTGDITADTNYPVLTSLIVDMRQAIQESKNTLRELENDISDVNSYADEKAAGALENAKAYADSKAPCQGWSNLSEDLKLYISIDNAFADLDCSVETDLEPIVEAAKAYTDTKCAGKVDKVTGKGLSQNDFTNALKAKVEGMDSLVTEKTSESLESAKTYADQIFKYSNKAVQMEKGVDYTTFGRTSPTAAEQNMRMVITSAFFSNLFGTSPDTTTLKNYTLFIKRNDMPEYFSAKVLGYESRTDGNYTLLFELNEYGIAEGENGAAYFRKVQDVWICILSRDLCKLVEESVSESLQSAKDYTDFNKIDYVHLALEADKETIRLTLDNADATRTFYAAADLNPLIDDLQSYAAEKNAETLVSTRRYADTKDAAALQSAKNYTDSAIGRERALLDNQPKITRTGEVLTGSDSIGVMEKLIISGGFNPSGEPSLEQAATVSFTEKLLTGNNGNLLKNLEVVENSTYTNGLKDCLSAHDGILHAANLTTEHILECCPTGSPSLLVSVAPFTMFKGVSYTCTYPKMEDFSYPAIYMYTTNENGSVVNIEGKTKEGVGHFNKMHLTLTPTEDLAITHIRLWINNTMLISSMSNYSVPDGAFPICIYKNSVQKDIPETETTVDISELALKGACSDTKEAYDQIVVDYRNKTVKHIQRYAKYTLSENSNLSVKTLTTATSVNRWQMSINSVSESPEDSKIGFCNILPFGSGFADIAGSNYPCIMTNNVTAYFKLPVSYGTDVAEVKQMLLDKGFYFWFVRKVPIETDITGTELGQALLNLTLSKEFSIQTTGTSGKHEITYVRDLNTVISELQNAVLALGGEL